MTLTPVEMQSRGVEQSLARCLQMILPEIREALRESRDRISVTLVVGVEPFKFPKGPTREDVG